MPSTSNEFTCSRCQGERCGAALSYGTRAPEMWHPDYASDPGSLLDADLCAIAVRAIGRPCRESP